MVGSVCIKTAIGFEEILFRSKNTEIRYSLKRLIETGPLMHCPMASFMFSNRCPSGLGPLLFVPHGTLWGFVATAFVAVKKITSSQGFSLCCPGPSSSLSTYHKHVPTAAKGTTIWRCRSHHRKLLVRVSKRSPLSLFFDGHDGRSMRKSRKYRG
jgi:hypothetical protein